MEKFTRSFDKLTKATEAMSRAANENSQQVGQDPKVFQVIARQALHEIKPMVRSMLLSNLNKSGLHDRTGKLRSAVENVVVGAKFDFNKPWRIYVKFPPDIEDYTSKTGAKSNPYKVFASLGHGYTRTSRGVERAKTKSLAAAKRKAIATGKESFKKKGATYTVVPPHPFFYLDEGQTAEVAARFMVVFRMKMESQMSTR